VESPERTMLLRYGNDHGPHQHAGIRQRLR
jgi:hypothetical protein